MYDEMWCDEEMVFEGTLAECRAYIKGFEDELYIVAPDGFTTVD